MASGKRLDIFGAVKAVCKLLGVYHYKSWVFEKTNWLINILLATLEFIHLLPSLAYLFRFHRIEDVNEVMSIAFPLIVNIAQYMLLVIEKDLLWELFEQFELLTNERKLFMIATKHVESTISRDFFRKNSTISHIAH